MIKIVYPACCGLGVYKNSLVLLSLLPNYLNVITYQTKSFSIFNDDILNLKKWFPNNTRTNICIEFNGKYWIPIFNFLEDSINVCLAHLKYVKAIKGKKTDKKTLNELQICLKHDLVPYSFIQPKDIKTLCDICIYRYKLACNRPSEKNRVQISMTGFKYWT